MSASITVLGRGRSGWGGRFTTVPGEKSPRHLRDTGEEEGGVREKGPFAFEVPGRGLVVICPPGRPTRRSVDKFKKKGPLCF